MNILHVNFSDSEGGAAQAVLRIHKLLLKKKINSKMLVCEKKDKNDHIIFPSSRFEIAKINLKKKISRNLGFIFKTQNKNTHSINLIPSGLHRKINKLNPEWVNLHWIGNEMISIKEISKIRSKIIWTLHDMWPLCGAEHYTFDERFIDGYKKDNRPNYERKFDLNKFVWNTKVKYLNKVEKIICTSDWMYKKAKKSFLFKDKYIELIPLTIDKDSWKSFDKNYSKKLLGIEKNQKVILFGADNFLKNSRKGFQYFCNAIKILKQKSKINYKVLLFGEDIKTSGFSIENYKNLGYVNDEHTLKLIYSAADVTVIPSILESFGLVALEAIHCGSPCVVFNQTGLTSLIEHKKNGYISDYKSNESLAEGILWCLEHFVNSEDKIREFAINKFDQDIFIKNYLNFLKR